MSDRTNTNATTLTRAFNKFILMSHAHALLGAYDGHVRVIAFKHFNHTMGGVAASRVAAVRRFFIKSLSWDYATGL